MTKRNKKRRFVRTVKLIVDDTIMENLAARCFIVVPLIIKNFVKSKMREVNDDQEWFRNCQKMGSKVV